MNLKIGDIVKVTEEECKHFDKQGQVVGFNPANREYPVRVWFGKECDSLFLWEEAEKLTDKHSVTPPAENEQLKDPRTWDYAEEELQKEPEWSMKTLADRHFPRFHHSYCEPAAPFVAGAEECCVEGCSECTTRRIIYNFWGTVCPADVCGGHAEKWHLKCTESFPRKKVPALH